MTTKAETNSIEIERTGNTQTGAIFRVWHADRILIDRTDDPEIDACRELLANGITGRLTTYHKGNPTPCLRMDIERGATLRTVDTALDGPRIAKWTPFDASRLRPKSVEVETVGA